MEEQNQRSFSISIDDFDFNLDDSFNINDIDNLLSSTPLTASEIEQINALIPEVDERSVSQRAYENFLTSTLMLTSEPPAENTGPIEMIDMAPQPERFNLGDITNELQIEINLVLEKPNELSIDRKIKIGQGLINRILENNEYIQSGTKLCCCIIERELPDDIVLTTILSLIKFLHQYRDLALSYFPKKLNSKFSIFTYTLKEFAVKLSKINLQKFDNSEENPRELILGMLVDCCVDCLKVPVKTVVEPQCCYSVLTALGQELQVKFPEKMKVFFEKAAKFIEEPEFVPEECKSVVKKLIKIKENHWQDISTIDTGTTDTGATDTGATDTGATDTSISDIGTSDIGTSDIGTSDIGTSDTGTTNTDTINTDTIVITLEEQFQSLEIKD